MEAEVTGRRLLAASRLSYVETGAALGRAAREGRGSARQTAQLLRDLDAAWPRVAVVELSEPVARSAVRISREQGLRASDSIHLASALAFAADEPRSVTFACFDRRLWEAAGTLGFERVPARMPG